MDDLQHHDDPISVSFLTKGSQVEVTANEDGFNGGWYVATVIHPLPPTTSRNHNTSNNLIFVEYHNLLSEDGSSTRLREYADISYVRPSPLPDPNPPDFQLNDLVDAFYRDGWWTGVITSVVDSSNFVVSFRNPPDEIRFCSDDLRIHRKWVGDRWVQPQKQVTVGWMFTVGKKVEVSFDRESFRDVWFPATVLKNSGNATFLVEYQHPGAGDEGVVDKVTVDYHHIRPSPPLLRDKNFLLSEKVDAYYDFGWWCGVITKELADNRYNVFFEHAKKEREFICSRVRPHLEWKGGKWFNTSQILTKRKQQENFDSNDKNSPNDETVNDDSVIDKEHLSDGQSEGVDSEVSGMTDQAVSKTENPSHRKEVHSTGEKSIEQKTSTDSPKQRVRLTNELKSLQALTMGSEADSIRTRTQKAVGIKDATESNPLVVMGLQCNQMTVISQEKTVHNHTNENVAKSDAKQPDVPLVPSTVLNQEGSKADAASVAVKRKRGRPPSRQVLSPKTPVTIDHVIGSNIPSTLSSVEAGQSKEVGLTTSSGAKLFLTRHTKKRSTRKRKRGRRRTISKNSESPAQEGTMEQSSKASYQGWLDSRNFPFIKSMALWKALESMEAFRMLPQRPHFRPLLENVKEGAQEGLAIGTMVTFSTVVDKTCSLRFDDPRNTIEDCLETLVELENNGFDVEAIRERLTGLLLIKDKHEELEEPSKGVVEKIEENKMQGKRIEEEIEEINREMRELEERRKEALLKKVKRVSEMGVMEAVFEGIKEEIREVGAEFDGLVSAPLV